MSDLNNTKHTRELLNLDTVQQFSAIMEKSVRNNTKLNVPETNTASQPLVPFSVSHNETRTLMFIASLTSLSKFSLVCLFRPLQLQTLSLH